MQCGLMEAVDQVSVEEAQAVVTVSDLITPLLATSHQYSLQSDLASMQSALLLSRDLCVSTKSALYLVTRLLSTQTQGAWWST